MSFPRTRMRRLRKTEAMRRLVQETRVLPEDLIQGCFVVEGKGVKQPIPSLPGQYHLSPDVLADEAKRLYKLGIPGILLFGVTDKKDPGASEAYNPDGIIQRAIAEVKSACPEILTIPDLCCCEYTDSGHCGILTKDGKDVDNDPTLELLAKIAQSYAKAGADIIAPSDMMDGRVGAVRDALDSGGFRDIAIMSYAVKYASRFYGPFREAAGSGQFKGTRQTYQMHATSSRQALREAELDIEEGADILMVKPALPYLDIIRMVSDHFPLPLAAYQVSGEYAMIKHAAKAGAVDEPGIIWETLTSIKRAGADIIITYFAREALEQGYLD